MQHLRPAAAFWLALGSLTSMPALAIVGGTPTTAFGQVANGVQLTANWVITARHVSPSAGDSFSNGFGSSVIAARYDAGSGAFPQDDISLLRLSTPINAPAISLVADQLSAGQFYAFDATLTTGANQVPRGFGFSQVRELLPFVDPDDAGPLPAVSAHLLIVYTDGYGQPYVQGGDSGGGLFLGHVSSLAGGAPLWGIASAFIDDRDANNNSINPRSGYVQLSSYRSWIDATLAADLTDGQTLNWVVTSVPEPGTALLLGLGLAVLARRSTRERPCACRMAA